VEMICDKLSYIRSPTQSVFSTFLGVSKVIREKMKREVIIGILCNKTGKDPG